MDLQVLDKDHKTGAEIARAALRRSLRALTCARGLLANARGAVPAGAATTLSCVAALVDDICKRPAGAEIGFGEIDRLLNELDARLAATGSRPPTLPLHQRLSLEFVELIDDSRLVLTLALHDRNADWVHGAAALAVIELGWAASLVRCAEALAARSAHGTAATADRAEPVDPSNPLEALAARAGELADRIARVLDPVATQH